MSLRIVLLFMMLPPREWPGSADGWPRASGHQHHLRPHLGLLELPVGLLINFGAATLKEGPHRGRELSAYDGPLLAAGAYLARVRQELCGELAPLVAKHAAAISPRGETSGMHYEQSGGQNLAEALAASAPEERRLRQTVVGPHRDDVRLELDGAAAATYASEGQQRTLTLALRLAQAELIRTRRGSPPVYLLDDIFGELDTERRRRLLAALPADSQRILTTTTWQWLEGEDGAAQWTIRDGAVCPAD